MASLRACAGGGDTQSHSGSRCHFCCCCCCFTGTDIPYRAYQITQTREVHRRFFRERTRKFTLDLADRAQNDMANKLHQHVLVTAPALDTWTDVKLNGEPVPDYTTLKLPQTGKISFVVHQKGTWGTSQKAA